MHSIFILILIVFVIQNQRSYQSKTNIPLIMNKEASQWLNIPKRWHQQYSRNQPSYEIKQSLKQLELLNENGIHQFDTKSIDTVSMEVLYELSRHRRLYK